MNPTLKALGCPSDEAAAFALHVREHGAVAQIRKEMGADNLDFRRACAMSGLIYLIGKLQSEPVFAAFIPGVLTGLDLSMQDLVEAHPDISPVGGIPGIGPEENSLLSRIFVAFQKDQATILNFTLHPHPPTTGPLQ